MVTREQWEEYDRRKNIIYEDKSLNQEQTDIKIKELIEELQV